MKSYEEISKEVNKLDERIFKILDKETTLIHLTNPFNNGKIKKLKEYLLNLCNSQVELEKELLEKVSEANINYNIIKLKYEEHIKILKEIKGGE